MCKHCKAELADGSKFCPACGKSTEEAVTKSVDFSEQRKTFDDLQKTTADLRDAFKKGEDERAEFGKVTSLTQEKIEKINSRIDVIETKSQRPPADPIARKSLVQIPGSDRFAFDAFCRKGVTQLSEAERGSLITLDGLKALTTLNDPSTGYLVPEEIIPGIQKNILEFSPIRAYARVRSTSNRSVVVTKKTGSFSAQWIGETETHTETTGLAYGQQEIYAREMYALVDISQIDLEDNAFNLESELQMEFGEQFGLAEGTSFISGAGPTQPEGILTSSEVDYTAGGDASAITSDAMMNIFYDLKDAYARNATWFMRRATLKAIRKLKLDDDQYIWQPGLQAGEPALILGRPYVETPDMPAIAADAYPILCGDLRRAYYVIDRVAIQVVRDNLTQAHLGMVRFIARKRVGAAIVLSEAVRKLKIATS